MGRRNPLGATQRDLEAYLAAGRWQAETRKSARGTLRSFFRWAYGTGLIEADPSYGLPTVRVPGGVARPTPEHLVRRLAHDDSRIGFMAQLAAYAGLRAHEIAKVHERDLVGDELLVLGKGRKVRALPIVQLDLLRNLERVEDWAFPNGRGSHLTAGHVTRLLSDALPDGWTAHTLRHRYATQAYAGTRDMFAVQELLGHSRPETTRRYVRLPDDARRAAAAGAA